MIEEAIAERIRRNRRVSRKRYSVPLSRVPKVINKYAKDIAVYKPVQPHRHRRGREGKELSDRYNAAIRFLETWQKGLSISASATVQQSGHGLFRTE
ncbi:phage protein Gp36 family protein [Paenibacillus melissococcoides]|uniref:phage protein Gp36 family protein n=1 Tax=Paenibacillus melissococcoides TaxID=2912268 RepID=UPI0036F3C170